jgi:hypothetical protein
MTAWSPTSAGGWRAGVVLGLLVVLLCVASVASLHPPPLIRALGAATGRGGESSGVLFELVAGAAVLAGIPLLLATRPLSHPPDEKERRLPLPRPPTTIRERLAIGTLFIVALAACAAIAFGAASLTPGVHHQRGHHQSSPHQVPAARAARDTGQPRVRGGAWLGMGVGVLGLAVLLVLSGTIRARRRPPPPGVNAKQGQAPRAAALQAAERGLANVDDPRAAVLAAYGALGRSLAAVGLPREPPEAPREYLERVLDAGPAAAAHLRRLTDLFEVARYSDRPIDAGDRAEALACLRAAQEPGSGRLR